MGESLGGEALIQSLSVKSRLSAIVADSAFSSFERIARDRVAQRLDLPPVWAGFLNARFLRAAS
jgi:hypothetical protein